MPRFSLQYLWVSFTFVVIGLAGVGWVLGTSDSRHTASYSTQVAVWVVSGMFIGMGIAIPTDRPLLVFLGAAAGFAVQALLVVALGLAM